MAVSDRNTATPSAADPGNSSGKRVRVGLALVTFGLAACMVTASHAAMVQTCPAKHGTKLKQVGLLDGPLSDMAYLEQDNPTAKHGGNDVHYIFAEHRFLTMSCE